MVHPLTTFLQSQRLSLRSFCIFNDLSFDTTRGFLYGKCRTIPKKIRRVLVRYEVNVDEFQSTYEQWLVYIANQDTLKLQQEEVAK